MRWLLVAGFAIAACAHGPPRPDAPPETLLAWADKYPLAAQEAIAHLLTWATRHPDAAQQIEVPALEWTAEHHGC